MAPIESSPETNAGMPVGIAEIAIAVPSSSTSLKSSPRATPTTTMNATAPHAMMPSTFVSESSSRCSGERVRVTDVSIVAICPISVCIPVAVTTIAPVPRVTAVFWNSMFERSPSATSASGEGAGVLGDRRALAGQRRLLRLERRRAHDPSVRRDDVAGLDLHDVAGHEVERRHERDRAVAHDPRLRHLQVGQRVDARPRLQLLPRAEHDVEQDQQRDDDAGRHLADDEADNRDRDQHDVHRVAQLGERDRPHRRRLLAGDLVRAPGGRAARPPRRRSGRYRRPSPPMRRPPAAVARVRRELCRPTAVEVFGTSVIASAGS